MLPYSHRVALLFVAARDDVGWSEERGAPDAAPGSAEFGNADRRQHHADYCAVRVRASERLQRRLGVACLRPRDYGRSAFDRHSTRLSSVVRSLRGCCHFFSTTRRIRGIQMLGEGKKVGRKLSCNFFLGGMGTLSPLMNVII